MKSGINSLAWLLPKSETMNRLLKIGVTYSLLLVAFSSCTDKENGTATSSAPNVPNVPTSSPQKVRVDTLATGLTSPWGMAFLPNNQVLITEKEGKIRVVQNGKLLPQGLQGVPEVYGNGQAGLLDIQAHPEFAQNGWIYFTYAKPGNGGGSTTLARAQLQNNALVNLKDLFTVDPYISSGVHFGSRIAFDGKGFVFISTGDRGTKPNAQSLATQNGKVLRLHDDGRVPADNPFVNTANAKPEIWSYGHRNVQGMAYDAATNTLWAHEHGPKGGDEINIVQKGKNYGWPVTTHGIDYDGSIISNDKEKEGIEPPIHIYVPSIAPCGLAVVTSDKYNGWKGSLLLGALAGQHVARVEVKDGKSVGQERLLEGIARVRAVKQGPDGYIYVLTESPGMFLRLMPAN
jgi:glucose/arabinose dehydrogenase